MAIKEMKRRWESCQLDYVKEFLCHTEKDVEQLPAYCIGSTAYVSETGRWYACGKDQVWKPKEEAMEEGGGDSSGGDLICEVSNEKIILTPFDDIYNAYIAGRRVVLTGFTVIGFKINSYVLQTIYQSGNDYVMWFAVYWPAYSAGVIKNIVVETIKVESNNMKANDYKRFYLAINTN